ncbi:hypothetical protein Tco_0168230 [Tanacetum coccineum]
MMKADRLLAETLQTREREELTDEEKGKLFMKLMKKRRKHFAALRAQEKKNKPPTKAQKRSQMSTYLKHMEAQESNEKKIEGSEEKAKGSRKKILGKKRAVKEQQQESSKRQRIKDDKHEEVEVDDEAELKKHLVIVKDDDIAIDVIPLATKPPVIVEYKLLKEGIMGIDREDLQTLWKLVKTKHGDSRPEDEHERVLWGDLKVMFEPDIKSDVWRNLQGYKVTIWKLFDSCGVHFVRNLKIQKMNIKFRGGLLGLMTLKVTTAQAPGVVKPEIRGNVNFEINSQFMRELRDDTFFGNKGEDAHDHIDWVHSIIGLFNILDINSHQKVNIFYKGLSTTNRQLLNLQGPILGMTPAQALTAIQTMADHSQKWHDRTTSRKIRSSSSNDGLADLVNKLDNLGRDMKKLKESVHAIQVRCQICEGPHLDKDCPLNKEVKQVEEVRYGEFGRTTPFNGNNGGKFRVRPPGYYTKTDNRPPYGERRQNLKELLAKHQEEYA